MPIYEYFCPDCEVTFEEFQSYKDEPLTTCNSCSKSNIRRVFSIGYIGGTSQPTLGKIAEKNTKNLGDYRHEVIQKMANQRKESIGTYKGKIPEGASVTERKKIVPEWRADHPQGPDMKLTKMTEAETTKYIIEGKTPIGLKDRK